ncbi:hypothetical protein QMG61_15690 [Cryobacterium sp. PH31-AA6]|uniref:hypothetical protein n=1 Tax=Cryobacterium sp. PH31-AA6 TaxID=3046205 RepID=UPI0024BA1554|nr:hypothetical protein [Cryobacterium sp. PH31-AA6]MDJ0325208.1 hypothetical protein [Cryobacterium sp. PH31-AA6]
MNDPTRPGQPLALARDDQHTVAAGHETGWWDDNGRAAPWPDDFLDPDAGWTTGTTDVPADDGDQDDPENGLL